MYRFKYRIHSYGKANRAGLLTDLLFYAKLKQVNDTGWFKEGTIHSSIESKFKMSRVTISSRLKSLVKNDFAKEIYNHKTGKRIAIVLRSYRYVYCNLFELHYNRPELYNISFKDINDLKAQIVLLEQYHHEIEKDKKAKRRLILEKDDQKTSDSSTQAPKSTVKPRSSEISCAIIASRLGYSNIMSGHRMKELARKKKYIKQNKVLIKHGFISLTTNHFYNLKNDKDSIKVIKKWLDTGLLYDRRYFTIKEGNKLVLYERAVNRYDLKKQSLISQREKKNKVSKDVLLIEKLAKQYKDLTRTDFLIFTTKDMKNDMHIAMQDDIFKLLKLASKRKIDISSFWPWFKPSHYFNNINAI